MNGPHAGQLKHFQLEVADLFFSLPQARGFLLAGGAALIAHGIVARETDDLDFFTRVDGGRVVPAAEALAEAASGLGWRVEWVRSGAEFRRIRIERIGDVSARATEEVFVDLAIDSPPTGEPTFTVAGPAFAAAELAVRKTLALFGRAEPRDFSDLLALHRRFDRAEILDAAAEADSGFDLRVFISMLRSHRRLKDEDFPASDDDLIDLRAYFDDWAEELEL